MDAQFSFADDVAEDVMDAASHRMSHVLPIPIRHAFMLSYHNDDSRRRLAKDNVGEGSSRWSDNSLRIGKKLNLFAETQFLRLNDGKAPCNQLPFDVFTVQKYPGTGV